MIKTQKNTAPSQTSYFAYIRARFSGWTVYVITSLIVAAFVFPFIWMIFASFRSRGADDLTAPLDYFTLDHYQTVLGESQFGLWTWNTIFIAIMATAFALIIGLPAAYSIAQFKQGRIAFAILLARITPGISYLIPWYIALAAFNMIGSYTAIIIGHLTVILPLAVWLMIPFFEDVPAEFRESALLDGCSEWGVFFRISLPFVRSGVFTGAIICFMFSWNHTFLYSLILSSTKTQPLPVAVLSYIAYGSVDWGALMAAATLITVPILVITFFVRKQLALGFATGGLKG